MAVVSENAPKPSGFFPQTGSMWIGKTQSY